MRDIRILNVALDVDSSPFATIIVSRSIELHHCVLFLNLAAPAGTARDSSLDVAAEETCDELSGTCQFWVIINLALEYLGHPFWSVPANGWREPLQFAALDDE